MFAKTINFDFAQRVVATLVASALVLWSIGAYATAQAANLTSVSNTMSDSDLSVTSAHSIAFTIPTGSSLGDGDTVTITFPAGFTGVAAVADANAEVSVNGSPDVDGSATLAGSGQDITFNTVSATAGQEVVVAIDDGIITNPGSAGSYEIEITTGADTGKTRVAIIDNVVVSAIVDTTFDFVITGLATSTDVNGDTTTGSTTPTEINFGTLVADTQYRLAQQLAVQTNAIQGFSVTVATDGDLQSSTGAVIDTFTDGTDIATAGTAWTAPGDNINDNTTWGHWGMTSTDSDLANDLDSAASYIAASTTPREVFSHNGPSDGLTTDIGTTTVGYQIEITPLQEAADDYTTTITYVATPTF